MSLLIKETAKTKEGAPSFEIREGQNVIVGCFAAERNKLYIWIVISTRKHFLKESLNLLVAKYGTTTVEFTQVIGADLIKKLRGFKPIIVTHPASGEKQLDLVGEWK